MLATVASEIKRLPSAYKYLILFASGPHDLVQERHVIDFLLLYVGNGSFHRSDIKVCRNGRHFRQFERSGIKFTRQGAVTLRISSTPRDDGKANLKIEVADTGIGIAPEKLGLIFDKFTQADASTTREFGGTGLGLTISRNLVEKMGGAISVTSNVGLGSLFTVTIPLAVQPVPEVVQKDVPSSVIPFPQGKGRILIVEDWQPNVLVAQLMLEMLGYTNAVARTGAEALAMCKAGSYAAVLMDMQLPDIDGCEVTRQLRELEKSMAGHRTPIIAATAYATREGRSKCLDAGMDGYISKPLDATQLAEVLEQLIAPTVEAGVAG